MPRQQAHRRVIAFVDGQNLIHAVREAFGYGYPNFDIGALARAICRQRGWKCVRVQFYTGIPTPADNPEGNRFWTAKLAVMKAGGVHVFTRNLRRRSKTIRLPHGQRHRMVVGQEKGIDVRLALDVVQALYRRECDIAMVFSQDQDLAEVAEDVHRMAARQRPTARMVSAFPSSSRSTNRRGINQTDWIRIDRKLYDQCLDRTRYRSMPGFRQRPGAGAGQSRRHDRRSPQPGQRPHSRRRDHRRRPHGHSRPSVAQQPAAQRPTVAAPPPAPPRQSPPVRPAAPVQPTTSPQGVQQPRHRRSRRRRPRRRR